MPLSMKEAQRLDRYIKAARAARAALEPHPSWEREKLRAKALLAIRDACGGSPGMDRVYELAEQTIGVEKS